MELKKLPKFLKTSIKFNELIIRTHHLIKIIHQLVFFPDHPHQISRSFLNKTPIQPVLRHFKLKTCNQAEFCSKTQRRLLIVDERRNYKSNLILQQNQTTLPIPFISKSIESTCLNRHAHLLTGFIGIKIF